MEIEARVTKVLEFLKLYLKKNGFSPSQKEIAVHLGLKSTGAVSRILTLLEEKDLITRVKGIPRSLRLRESSPFSVSETEVLSLPLKGAVAAGIPLEYHLEEERFQIPAVMVKDPEKTYLLRVEGDSMIEESINTGDYLVVEHRESVSPGEMIVAMVNFSEATLKRYYPEKDRIRLQPSNSAMKPIYVQSENLSIHGVVVGIMRMYR